MTLWVDSETGELFVEGDCPNCAATREETDIQITGLERENRVYRSRATRAERKLEAESVTRRDGQSWKTVLREWMAAFPEQKITAKGVKSARATQYFLRLESECSESDVVNAIHGAKKYPYVVYGKRRATGSESDLAIDLQDIVSVKNDRNFDFLVEVGRTEREKIVF